MVVRHHVCFGLASSTPRQVLLGSVVGCPIFCVWGTTPAAMPVTAHGERGLRARDWPGMPLNAHGRRYSKRRSRVVQLLVERALWRTCRTAQLIARARIWHGLRVLG
jgi:hypothetical protein